MTDHTTGTRVEWLAARLDLLRAEKEHTRQADGLARRRQELPWVRVEKEYQFETDEGTASLADLFRGRSQLLVYHFMFGYGDYVDEENPGCTACSFVADHFDGVVPHLNGHDVTLMAESIAPLEDLRRYKQRMGWRFPWVSSVGSKFKYDFGAAFTDEQQRSGAEYNFGHIDDPGQQAPGMSAFALADGVVYHTYSTYARGVEQLMGTYRYLDLAPLGRNEDPATGGAATTSTTHPLSTTPRSSKSSVPTMDRLAACGRKRRYCYCTTPAQNRVKAGSTPWPTWPTIRSTSIRAANGGAPNIPDWYHNLDAHPITEIEVGNETINRRRRDDSRGTRAPLAEEQPNDTRNSTKPRRRPARLIPMIVLTPRRNV